MHSTVSSLLISFLYFIALLDFDLIVFARLVVNIYENINPVPVEIARYEPNDNDGVSQINIFNLVFTF